MFHKACLPLESSWGLCSGHGYISAPRCLIGHLADDLSPRQEYRALVGKMDLTKAAPLPEIGT